MINEESWIRWVMQTAKTTDDIASVLKLNVSESVNDDHKQLMSFALELNNLIDTVRSGDVDIEIIKNGTIMLKNFYEYTKYHFEREEDLILKFHLPYLDRQKEQHSMILTNLINLIDDFELGRLSFTLKLKLSVLEWVINHINETDFETFTVENFKNFILKVNGWKDLNDIIKRVGLSDIDNQHKYITEKTIDLIKLINKKGELSSLNPILENLRKLQLAFEDHFTFEENFITKNGIKNLREQHHAHASFLEKTNLIFEQLKLGQTYEVDEFKEYIILWWINHINTIDFETFHISNWAVKKFEEAKKIEDVLWILKFTGIEKVDNDHVEFIKICLEITNSLIDDPDNYQKNMPYYFSTLFEYARNHFIAEEIIMNMEVISNTKNHREEHKRILEFLRHKKDEIDAGHIYMSSIHQLKGIILGEWLHHTNIIDYRSFVEEKEL